MSCMTCMRLMRVMGIMGVMTIECYACLAVLCITRGANTMSMVSIVVYSCSIRTISSTRMMGMISTNNVTVVGDISMKRSVTMTPSSVIIRALSVIRSIMFILTRIVIIVRTPGVLESFLLQWSQLP